MAKQQPKNQTLKMNSNLNPNDMIHWTPESNQRLEELYNQGKTDTVIAAELGTTFMAVAKQRSNIGLTKFKKREGLHRAPKTEQPKVPLPDFIIHYTGKEGNDHFLNVKGADPNKIARQMMLANGIKYVFIYKPIKKLVLQGIAEVEL